MTIEESKYYLNLKDLAEKVKDKVFGIVEDTQNSILVVLAIISFLISIYKLWKECKKPDQIPNLEVGYLSKLYMYWRAKRVLKQNGLDTKQAWTLVNTTLDLLKKYPHKQLMTLMSEAEVAQL